jgi:hypothetical protein
MTVRPSPAMPARPVSKAPPSLAEIAHYVASHMEMTAQAAIEPASPPQAATNQPVAPPNTRQLFAPQSVAQGSTSPPMDAKAPATPPSTKQHSTPPSVSPGSTTPPTVAKVPTTPPCAKQPTAPPRTIATTHISPPPPDTRVPTTPTRVTVTMPHVAKAPAPTSPPAKAKGCPIDDADGALWGDGR